MLLEGFLYQHHLIRISPEKQRQPHHLHDGLLGNQSPRPKMTHVCHSLRGRWEGLGLPTPELCNLLHTLL